eukprot:1833784-Rhodomonas_salina.1
MILWSTCYYTVRYQKSTRAFYDKLRNTRATEQGKRAHMGRPNSCVSVELICGNRVRTCICGRTLHIVHTLRTLCAQCAPAREYPGYPVDDECYLTRVTLPVPVPGYYLTRVTLPVPGYPVSTVPG